MSARFASCCVLSYERPEFLAQTIGTMIAHADFPMEIIVHDDGSENPAVRSLLRELLDRRLVSAVIENPPGHNQGQGVAVNRMFSMAKGDFLLKIDQDLLFKRGWLRRAVEILDGNWERRFYKEDHPEKEPLIGALGLFRYPAEPVKYEDMFIQDFPTWEWHEDFVGSALVMRAETYRRHGPWEERSEAFAEDLEFKKLLKSKGFVMALPRTDDFCSNQGFGEGPSTVVVRENGQLTSRKIKTGPSLVDPLKLVGR